MKKQRLDADRLIHINTGGRTRRNPWRYFSHSDGAEVLAWVAAGNVAIMSDRQGPTKRKGGRTATLWAKTEALLVEAADAVGLRPPESLKRRFWQTDPYPHCPLFGRFLLAAYAIANSKKGQRRSVRHAKPIK